MADRSAPDPSQHPVAGVSRYRANQDISYKQTDLLAVEEPLEIVLGSNNRKPFTLAITMRTPGNDHELAVGFLLAEGIIRHKKDIQSISSDLDAANPDNNISIVLSQDINFEPDRLQRHFFTNSSCGICGKTSMQALELLHQPDLSTKKALITADTLCKLPQTLRQQQAQFSATGSMHSAALFSMDGKLLRLSEDVGRHNAMDKLLGSLLLADELHLAKHSLLMVSGRASFELVQKALMVDIPVLASIGAPTSLAYQLADRHGMTLIGFLKSDSFNVYSVPERIN